MSDFDAEFERLAEQVATGAQDAENLPDKVDALKALMPYYALRKKHKINEPAEGTMDALRKQIQLVGGQDADAA